MKFEEITELTAEERSALEYLESVGWSIMTEVRIEDCKIKDGSRRRTFANSGRYDCVVGMKKFGAEAAVAPQTEGAPADMNFWMDFSNWKRMPRDNFFILVVNENLDDLKAAPADVQAEVKKKFDKFFDEADWPL
jgi:hypothetical protein